MQQRTKAIILGQMLEGLNQATGAAGHLIHHRQDARWFNIRDILEAVKAMLVAEAVEPMFQSQKKKEIEL
jgi:hypothetical protein